MMHKQILSEYLTKIELDIAEPNFPRSANRYEVTFGDRATAVKFRSAVKAKPCSYTYTDNGETIVVRASWPKPPEQQARRRLFKPIFDAHIAGGLGRPSADLIPSRTEADRLDQRRLGRHPACSLL